MSEIDGQFIKRGLWTNLDYGQIMGATITTDTRTGIIIIAIVAVMSTIGTSHLWDLVVFAYHQVRATGFPTDGLFCQQQAILRTLPPPSSLMAESVKLWWSWRSRNNRVLARCLFQFLLATLCTVGFVAAGIFSSSVVTTTDLEVLVRSTSCGFFNNSAPIIAVRVRTAAINTASAPYARECYGGQAVLPARCKAFIRPSIPFTTEKSPCPFASRLCTGADTDALPAIAFDSGLVSLNDGFGMNLPKRDSVSYRRRTTCAVLPVSGYMTVLNASDIPQSLWGRITFPGEEAVTLHYGERSALGEWKNVSAFWSLLTSNLTMTYVVSGRSYSAAQYRDGAYNALVPIEGIRRDDADVTILTLITGIMYANPVHDPWFLALTPITVYDFASRENSTVYVPDSPGKSMGCTIQHQFCINTDNGTRCSKLDGLPRNVTTMDWQGASSLQLSALRLLVEANSGTGLENSEIVAADSLERSGLIVGQIPPDQWVIEARVKESFVWASLQVSFANFAVGLGIVDSDLADHVIKPTTPGDKQLCRSQKMRKAGGFVNVNVFGMAFIIALSLLFAAIDILLLKSLIFHSGFRRALSPRFDRWVQDGVLQLQRRAYEADGQGTWSNLDKEVPVTEPEDVLTALPPRSVKRAKGVALFASTTSLSPSATHLSSATALSSPPEPGAKACT